MQKSEIKIWIGDSYIMDIMTTVFWDVSACGLVYMQTGITSQKIILVRIYIIHLWELPTVQ
jgi:hypothetical protein